MTKTHLFGAISAFNFEIYYISSMLCNNRIYICHSWFFAHKFMYSAFELALGTKTGLYKFGVIIIMILIMIIIIIQN